MSQLSSKHVIGIEHLTVDDIQLILKTATQFKEIINRPIKKVPTLRDITIANLFLKILPYPYFGFELAQNAYRADIINFFIPSSVKKGETLLDTGKQYTIDEGRYDCNAPRKPGAAHYPSERIDAQIKW